MLNTVLGKLQLLSVNISGNAYRPDIESQSTPFRNRLMLLSGERLEHYEGIGETSLPQTGIGPSLIQNAIDISDACIELRRGRCFTQGYDKYSLEEIYAEIEDNYQPPTGVEVTGDLPRINLFLDLIDLSQALNDMIVMFPELGNPDIRNVWIDRLCSLIDVLDEQLQTC